MTGAGWENPLHPDPIDRTSIRQRPRGWPIMYQTWDKLLFLHWPVEPRWLRPLIPAGLEIDTWDGSAWLGVTPFSLRGMRAPLTPALPIVSTSLELNVRTYVHRDGVPGIWFLSLDASNVLAVWGARLGFSLPYFRAAMKMHTDGDRINFHSTRTHSGAVPAEFEASWQVGARVPQPAPETRDFFLIERYCLYSSAGNRLYRARVHHRPWPLCSAVVGSLNAKIIESSGLPPPTQAPLVHAQAESLHVGVWPPAAVD